MTTQQNQSRPSICDSETSLDYYVTTVDHPSPPDIDEDCTNDQTRCPGPVVVSIDSAGTVKLRKRKKSKRRKKKGSLFLDEGVFRASDDGVIYQSSGSDSSARKVPRRASSLCDRYLKKNSTTESFNRVLSEHKRRNGRKPPIAGYSIRIKENLENIDPNADDDLTKCVDDLVCREKVSPPLLRPDDASSTVLPEENSSKSAAAAKSDQGNIEFHEVAASKKLNRNDALAAISAFMKEVEKATTVAKQQEGEKKRELTNRESALSTREEKENGKEESRDRFELHPLESARHVSPERVFLKSISVGQQSAVSGSVFLSDTESTNKDEVAVSMPDGDKLATDAASIVDPAVIDKDKSSKSLSQETSAAKVAGADYGLEHLQQVCKLFEQIGGLKKQNDALKNRVLQLEAEVKRLNTEKAHHSATDGGFPDTYCTLHHPKRTKRVGRLKDAIVKSSRKPSLDKQQRVHGFAVSHDGTSLATLTSSNLSPGSKHRPIFRSNANLNSNRERLYSHDDIELATKDGKWRFWKGSNAERNPTRRRIPSLKYDETQRPSIPIQKAYRTVDSLLGNAHDDTGLMTSREPRRAKLIRTTSRVSEAAVSDLYRSSFSSSPGKPILSEDIKRAHLHRSLGEGLGGVSRKESFRQKLSKLEKAAAKKFSLESFKRTNSMDRVVNRAENYEDSSASEPKWTSNDIYKSLPCVMSGSHEDCFEPEKKHSVPSLPSTEWNELQEAFPTKRKSDNTANRLPSALRSRLMSPLRKKHNKRNTSSSSQRKQGYYLPNTGEGSFDSNMEQVETMCDQLTLDLDHDEVKEVMCPAVDVDELNYLMKETLDVQRKLSVIDKSDEDSRTVKSIQLTDHRPSLSMTKPLTKGAVHSDDSEPSRFAFLSA